MKNLKYFPFDRNQYYYGKLLTEQDFNQEQRYMNDKRRLHNRFLHGVGVAAGFQVVVVDEKSISVEAGLALDFAGREIVSDTPVMRRLSTIDGFDTVMENRQGDYVYLCLEYDEQDEMPAHNAAAGRDPRTGHVDYDKSREGYRLYLTDREPESVSLTIDSLMYKRTVLYQDARLLVVQQFPKFVQAGEEFEVTVSVENKGNPVMFSLQAAQEVSGGICDGKSRMEVVFEDTVLSRAERVEKIYRMRALDIQEGEIRLAVSPDGFCLWCENQERELSRETECTVLVAAKDRISQVKEQFFRDAMEEAMGDNYPQGIYLSRIYLVKTEDAYMIDRAEAMPFDQYAYSTSLVMGVAELLRQELLEANQQNLPREEKEALIMGNTGKSSVEGRGFRMAEGVVRIDLGIGGKRGQRYFSHEIFHGLGLGPVSIELAVQEEDMLYCGSCEVFGQMEIRAELAAKADMSKGSFVIGLRLLEASNSQTAVVHWKAAMAEHKEEALEKRIYILPGKLELHVRESCYLEAVCEGMPGAQVVWNTAGMNHGFVSQDGMYTAPDLPGVYEVTAECQGQPQIRASLFIIVRE